MADGARFYFNSGESVSYDSRILRLVDQRLVSAGATGTATIPGLSTMGAIPVVIKASSGYRMPHTVFITGDDYTWEPSSQFSGPSYIWMFADGV